MQEIWKAVAGREGYEVSNLGRVRSLDRTITWKRRNPETKQPETVQTALPGRMLTPQPDTSGHLRVRLGMAGFAQVHVLVLEAFEGPRPAGQYGRHLDDNPLRNELENLAWGTAAENVADAQRNGLRLEGADNPNAKLSREDIAAIKALRGQLSNRAIGVEFDVSHTTINAILNGNRYRDITGGDKWRS